MCQHENKSEFYAHENANDILILGFHLPNVLRMFSRGRTPAAVVGGAAVVSTGEACSMSKLFLCFYVYAFFLETQTYFCWISHMENDT